MKNHARDEVFQIRMTKEEKETLKELSEQLEETNTETIVKAIEMRKDLLNYIIENNLDDNNLNHFKEIVMILVNNLKLS